MITLERFRAKQIEAEKAFVRAELIRARWSCSKAAQSLGLSPPTLLSTLRRLDLIHEYRKRNPGRGRPKNPKMSNDFT